MTGYGDEKIAVDVMKLGAKDYLVKDINFIEMISSTIKQVIFQIETEKSLYDTRLKLEESEERYRLITENGNALICEIDKYGHFLFVNSAYEKQLGYKKDEILGKNSLLLYSRNEIKNTLFLYKKLLKDSIPFRYETRLRHKEGFYRWYECDAVILKTKDNKNRIFNILYDVTERKKNEEQLKMAKEEAINANETKTQFLANMSHEIRTPLNGLLGMANLLSKTELDDKQKKYLELVKTSGQILLNIINDILDISKIEAGKYIIKNEIFNLNQLVDLLISEMSVLASNKKLELICDIDKSIPNWLIGDSVVINQILINIIGNAIKFTEKGKIELILTKLMENKEQVVIKFVIKDQGIGIPEDKIDEIFERFKQIENGYSKKNQGTGLGLAIVKKLIELLQGNIKAESKVDFGSVFTVEIPFKKGAQTVCSFEENGIEVNIINKSKISILIAEDNAINALFLKELLINEGYEVDVAINGQKALDKTSKKGYDLIFMDVQMPEMDGFETTKRLREKGINTPVIALTAYSMQDDREKCLSSGMNDYISKPINEREVFNKISKFITKR